MNAPCDRWTGGISTSDRCRGVAWELVSALVICLECGYRENNCSVLLYSSMYRTITRTLTYAAYMLHIFFIFNSFFLFLRTVQRTATVQYGL